MTLRAKTKKRLAILVVLGLVVVTALGSVYGYSRYKKQAQAKRWREEGLAAFKQGDYTETLYKLGGALQARVIYNTDIELVAAYAESRLKLEEADGKHIGQAIQAYRNLVNLQPGNESARRTLLDLYTNVHFGTEAQVEAEYLLQKYPRDPKLRRAETLALAATRHFPEAKDAAEEWIKAAPLEMDGHAVWLQIMLARNAQPREIMEHFSKLLQTYPNDPRFELLASLACSRLTS